MSDSYQSDGVFRNISYEDDALKSREFESCEFHHCDFSRGRASDVKFVDCRFIECNFSSAKLYDVSFRNVTFEGCKLLGIDFTTCNKLMFSVQFENCRLDFSSFFGMNLKKTPFHESTLKEVDFTEADLTGAVFDNCNLERTVFQRTTAEYVDFRTSYNFSIDPENNRLQKAKFSEYNLRGLLDKYNLDIEPGS